MKEIQISSGTPLRCDNCGKEWAPQKNISARRDSGVRCPECHSRYVRYARSGSWVVPGRKKKGAEKVLKERRKHRETREEDAREEEGEEGEGHRETFHEQPDRAQKLAMLRQRLSGPTKPVRMIRPGPGGESEIEFEEEGGPEEPEEEREPRATDLIPLDEIIDKETILSLHELELEWLLEQAEVKKGSKHERMISSMSSKVQRMIQLIFADMTIPMALKVLLVLYVIQQVALIGVIAGESPKRKRKRAEKEAATA